MKKIALVFALLFSWTLLAQQFTADGIEYKITSASTVEVSDYTGISTTVNIPTTVTNNHIAFIVTTIGFGAFFNKSLRSIIIPNCVTSIGKNSFRSNLLSSVTIPNSVITIGDSAFADCTNLASIDLSDSVTTIGNSAFANCTSLASVNLPDSIASIGDYTFVNCTSLASIYLPDSVTAIGLCAFYFCTRLASVNFPNSLTSIGDYAFANCTSLASIDLPNSLIAIGSYAFRYCTGLTCVFVANSMPISISSVVFNRVTLNKVELIVLKGAKVAYEAASVWQDFNPITEILNTSITLDNKFSKGLIASSGSTANFEVTITKPDAINAYISELTTGAFKLHSNPVISALTVDHNSEVKIDSITIYNLNGALVSHAQHTNLIALSELALGMYVVKIKAGDTQEITKIIKN